MDSRAVNFGGLLFVGVRSVVGNRRQAKSGVTNASCAHIRADRRRGRRNLLLSN
jgi:hypothetical protein